MTDHPIIFSAPMIRALLEKRKTQTRRCPTTRWARIQLGDRLWVQEAWSREGRAQLGLGMRYYASASEADKEWFREEGWTWNSPAQMPRWASRLILIVTGTRLERLQDISEGDAKAEGIGPLRQDGRLENGLPESDGFADRWDTIHGAGAWDANPDVVVLTFAVYHSNIDSRR